MLVGELISAVEQYEIPPAYAATPDKVGPSVEMNAFLEIVIIRLQGVS